MLSGIVAKSLTRQLQRHLTTFVLSGSTGRRSQSLEVISDQPGNDKYYASAALQTYSFVF